MCALLDRAEQFGKPFARNRTDRNDGATGEIAGRLANKINLVEHKNGVVIHLSEYDRAQFAAMSGVNDHEPEIRISGFRQRAAYAFRLDRIGNFTKSSSIGDDYGISADIQMNLDNISGRTGTRRCYRNISPRQLIDETRFADIRLTDNSDVDPFTQNLAASLIVNMLRNLISYRRCFALRILYGGIRNTFIGKIDQSFNLCDRPQQTITPSSIDSTQLSLKLSQCLPALLGRFGADKIRDPFCRRQIELAILECASRKFSRVRRAKALNTAQDLIHGRNDRTTAVKVEFSQIFARIAIRRRKPEDEGFVDCFVSRMIPKSRPRAPSRLRNRARNIAHHFPGPGSGYSNYGDRAPPGGRGKCKYCIIRHRKPRNPGRRPPGLCLN